MSGRVAAVPVHVHTDDGPVVYAPGDEVPAEHVALISNPNVWGADEDEADDKPKRTRTAAK